MRDVMEPTHEPEWILSHEGYDVLTESAVESCFALAKWISWSPRGSIGQPRPHWVSWLGYIKWASWPGCYVADLFDRPNTEPPVLALLRESCYGP
jgi:hypothetical protein